MPVGIDINLGNYFENRRRKKFYEEVLSLPEADRTNDQLYKIAIKNNVADPASLVNTYLEQQINAATLQQHKNLLQSEQETRESLTPINEQINKKIASQPIGPQNIPPQLLPNTINLPSVPQPLPQPPPNLPQPPAQPPPNLLQNIQQASQLPQPPQPFLMRQVQPLPQPLPQPPPNLPQPPKSLPLFPSITDFLEQQDPQSQQFYQANPKSFERDYDKYVNILTRKQDNLTFDQIGYLSVSDPDPEKRSLYSQVLNVIADARQNNRRFADLPERLTREFFGPNVGFTDLTDKNQIKMVNDAVTKTLVLIEGAKTVAEATAKQNVEENAPLNEKAIFWLNGKTGRPADPGDTLKGVKEKGFVPITQKGLAQSVYAKSGLILLDKYESVVKKLLVKSTGNTLKDLVLVQSNRGTLRLKENAGDPDVRLFRMLTASLPIMARATADSGNVGEKERTFMEQFVPTDYDTVESSLAVIQQARDIFKGVLASSGIPSPESAPPIKNENGIEELKAFLMEKAKTGNKKKK